MDQVFDLKRDTMRMRKMNKASIFVAEIVVTFLP